MPWPVFADTCTIGDVAAVFLGDDLIGDQFLLDPVRIGIGLVDLVHRHDDRHAGSLGVVDRLDRLRHHAVVGCHHQDDDVGGLGAARTHRGERLVARRVEEGDDAARGLDVVRADVLGDAAGLAGGDLGAPDVVEQRRLAVVDVAHHRHHRRTVLLADAGMAGVVDEERLGVVELGRERLVAHLRRPGSSPYPGRAPG